MRDGYARKADAGAWQVIRRDSPGAVLIEVQEIGKALKEFGGFLSAYVLMPDYVHLLAYLPDGDAPVRRRLVEHPGDWAFSSWRFYEAEGSADLEWYRSFPSGTPVSFGNEFPETPKRH